MYELSRTTVSVPAMTNSRAVALRKSSAFVVGDDLPVLDQIQLSFALRAFEGRAGPEDPCGGAAEREVSRRVGRSGSCAVLQQAPCRRRKTE
jgi:hypothetical protein